MTKQRTDWMIRVRILYAGIRARRGTAAMLFVVAVVAVAAAAIGPMFLHSADTSVLTSTADAAPLGQSDLTVIANGGATTMTKVRAASKTAEHLADGLLSPALISVDTGSHFVVKGQPYESDVVSRTGLCTHLRFVKGSCPRAKNDVALSKRSAALAGLGLGSHLQLSDPRTTSSLEVTVGGIYLPPSSVNDNYWKNDNYFDYGSGSASNIILDPMVSSMSTALSMSRLARTQITADLAWRPRATLEGASLIRSTAQSVESTLFHRYDLVVSSGVTSVLNAARHDDHLMSTVVLAIVLQLLLLSLLILYSLGKSTIDGRRPESEFARRHGFPRLALMSLAIGEPATLIVAAFPVGLVVAWGTLVIFTRTLLVAGTPVTVPGTAIVASAGVCLLGVIAMTFASADLWRSRASSHRQVKRATIAIDAFALALVVGGLLLLLTKGAFSASRSDSPTLLAPVMLTLGAALLGLRAASFVVTAAIARSAESSHVAWFLALRQIGRRPAALRRLLPLTAATAVLLFAVSSFFLASSNRSIVANFEVGASEVVSVTPPAGLNFEAAVRRADPSGHQAMAVADFASPTGVMVAVDSSRLAAVADWPASLSSTPLAEVARELSPTIPHGVSFSGTTLRVTFNVERGTPPIEVGVNLFDETYQRSHTAYVGPVTSGRHRYAISLSSDCPGDCRLTGLVPNWASANISESTVVSFALDGVSVQRARRWHAVEFGSGRAGTWSVQPSSIRVSSTGDDVAFEIPGRQLSLQGLLLSPVDLPATVPALVTSESEGSDAPPTPSPQGDLDVDLGGGLVTIHPVEVVSTLPMVGQNGVLTDFALAQRAATSSQDFRTYQVWLAPKANPDILARLRADGVTIGTVSSASARLGVLNHGGVALAYAVALLVTPIAALLAVGTVAFVIIAEGRRRRREVLSLFMAGVSLSTLRRAQLVESALVLSTALVLGTIIGFVTDTLALSSLPQFVAGTNGLPISRAVPIVPFVGAVAIFGALLALATELSTRVVMRSRRHQFDGEVTE
jgi:putative ABC transport system permease protein